MIKPFAVLIAMALTSASFSQNFFFHIEGGMMNYGGDLQEKLFTFHQGNKSIGFGLGYQFSGHFSASLAYTTGKLAASDVKTNVDNAKRNLSFYSNISETNLEFQASLFDISTEQRFTPYVFGGVAWFNYNPYAYSNKGEKVFLQPLNTEGQGLPQYPERKPYKLNQMALPFGFGVSYALSNSLVLGAEVGFRKLFTDYLDDVSSLHYADTALLRSAYGDLSAKMSFRSDETANPLSFNTDRIQRGNPERKDSYYTAMIKVSFLFGNMFRGSDGSFSRSVRKQSGCPTKVL